MTASARVRSVLRAAGPRRGGPERNLATGLLAATPSVIYVGEAVLGPRAVDPVLTTLGAALAAVCAVLLFAGARRAVGLLQMPSAVIGCGSIVLLDLGTGNAGVTGLLYFYLPVLFAAVHLRIPGVVAVTAAALAGEAVVALSLLPVGDAALDLAFVGSTLTLMAAALARAGVAQDRLVGRLRRLADVDPLTGLATRRILDDAVQRAVDRDAAETALVLIDVDWFKEINDTYGHAVGDDALTHIAATLCERCRAVDVVARLGGDELAVLMPGCSFDLAAARAKDFVDAVRARPLTLPDGRVVPVSISAGAAHAPSQAHTARDLYTSADAALYAAKRARRAP
ncbi:GGDEF domain-containing protein [Dactylosporangium sp. NPDC049742]|uniref:GGDEF domain-containing protein n=1 Tax=Dactylosporangium sp. NPDC049742 TaxID=3154737 RepID=UPI003435C883